MSVLAISGKWSIPCYFFYKLLSSLLKPQHVYTSLFRNPQINLPIKIPYYFYIENHSI